jgi:hypothetical protein
MSESDYTFNKTGVITGDSRVRGRAEGIRSHSEFGPLTNTYQLIYRGRPVGAAGGLVLLL